MEKVLYKCKIHLNTYATLWFTHSGIWMWLVWNKRDMYGPVRKKSKFLLAFHWGCKSLYTLRLLYIVVVQVWRPMGVNIGFVPWGLCNGKCIQVSIDKDPCHDTWLNQLSMPELRGHESKQRGNILLYSILKWCTSCIGCAHHILVVHNHLWSCGALCSPGKINTDRQAYTTKHIISYVINRNVFFWIGKECTCFVHKHHRHNTPGYPEFLHSLGHKKLSNTPINYLSINCG